MLPSDPLAGLDAVLATLLFAGELMLQPSQLGHPFIQKTWVSRFVSFLVSVKAL